MTAQDALQALAATAANAVTDVLRELTGEEAGAPEISLPVAGRDPLEAATVPAVAATAEYSGGVQGGNVLVLGETVARQLAGDEDELGDEQLPALTEALGRVMGAAAAATGEAIDEVVQTEAPDVRIVRAKADFKPAPAGAARAVQAVFEVLGEPCLLVLLVPTVFTMRMTQAMHSGPEAGGDAATAGLVRDALRDVPLRVWAELGRARLRTVEVAALGDGAIVELDHAADDPVDIYVNGSRIATGRLIRLDESDWAVRLEEVFAVAEPGDTPSDA